MKLRLFVCTVILFFGIEVTIVHAQQFKLDSDKETHPYNKFDNVNDIDSIKIYYLMKGKLSTKLPKRIGKVKSEFFFENGKLIRVNDYSQLGKLWNVFEFEYLPENNYTVRRFNWVQKLKYAWYYEKGLIRKAEKYSSKEKPKVSWTYRYEKDSLLVSERKFDNQGQLVFEIEQEYDSNGNRELYKQIEKDVLIGLQTFQFDSLGNLIRTEVFDSDSTTILEYEANSDTLNNITEINKQHELRRKSGLVKYFYSDDGKISQRKVFKANGKLDYREEFVYNEQLKLKKHQIFNAKRLVSETVRNYDQNNKLKAYKYYKVLLNKPRLFIEYFNTRNASGNFEIEVIKRRDTNDMEVYRYYYY